jgi:hypothetical protein
VGPEIDDLLLMHAKDAENLADCEQGQMGEGAKSAVADQHIPCAQIRMHLANARHVMGPQRSACDLQQQAAARVKERQQMNHRKTLISWHSCHITLNRGP